MLHMVPYVMLVQKSAIFGVSSMQAFPPSLFSLVCGLVNNLPILGPEDSTEVKACYAVNSPV